MTARRRFTRLTTAAAALAAGSMLLTACSTADDSTSADTADLTEIRVGLTYIAQVQFFPYYWAEDQGMYADAGLTVDVTQGGETPALSLLAADQLDIALADPFPILAALESGEDLVAFGVQFQESSTAMTCRADSGITEPSDLAGHTLGIKEFALDDLPLILAGTGLEEGDFEVAPVGGSDLANIIAGNIDCLYTTVAQSEPYAIQSAGVDTVVFPISELGITAQQNVFVTTREKWEDEEFHAALVDWLSVTSDAFVDMIEEPEMAANFMVDEAFVDGLDIGEEVFQAENQIPFMVTEYTAENGLLALNPEIWAETAQIAVDFGRTDTLVDVEPLLNDLTDEAGTPQM